MDTEYILETLEQELKTFEHPRIIQLSCDKWITSSAMQKTIRRGQVKLALRAGFTLWQQDRASFWRRVHVMACEDVGIASPDVVIKVLTAYAHPSWRGKAE
jgi:replication-associated recombination protein RarA